MSALFVQAQVCRYGLIVVMDAAGTSPSALVDLGDAAIPLATVWRR